MIKLSISGCLVAAACTGGGSGGSGSIDSMILGQAYTIRDAVSASAPFIDENGDSGTQAVIVLSSTSGLCSDVASNVLHPNEQLIGIDVWSYSGTNTSYATPTATGSYMIEAPGLGVPAGLYASFSAYTVDASCNVVVTSEVGGINGDAELTTISGDLFVGTFATTTQSLSGSAEMDAPSGTFDPEPCAALATASSSAAVACH